MVASTLPVSARFAPSPYQERIFEFCTTPVGPVFFQTYQSIDGFVDAVAGSGKTSTLVGITQRLDEWTRRNTLVCSFGKAIANELKRRMPEGVNSATTSSLAYRCVRPYVQASENWEADDKKYRKLAICWAQTHFNMDWKDVDVDTKAEVRAIAELVGKMFVTLTDQGDLEALQALAERFELQIFHWDWVALALPLVLKWGREGLPVPVRGKTLSIKECFQFDELMWIAALEPVRPWTYRGFIMVDEAQDLSPAQLKFILKLRGNGGRFLFVGDRRQAIYAFAGANSKSFEAIQQATNAVKFDLPVNYRCPRPHIQRIQPIVPQIQAHDGAIEGVMETIYEDQFVETLDRINADLKAQGKGGQPALMICRCIAPLVTMCYHLLGQGRNARMRNRKIGEKLTEMLETIERMDKFTFDHFVEFTMEWEARQLTNLNQAGAEDNEIQIEALHDRVAALLAVHNYITSTRTVGSIAELRAELDTLFDDETVPDVVLSTVHSAKGLEAELVAILHPHLMPSSKARTEEAIEQEQNLIYVAGTRSTYALLDVLEKTTDTRRSEATSAQTTLELPEAAPEPAVKRAPIELVVTEDVPDEMFAEIAASLVEISSRYGYCFDVDAA